MNRAQRVVEKNEVNFFGYHVYSQSFGLFKCPKWFIFLYFLIMAEKKQSQLKHNI